LSQTGVPLSAIQNHYSLLYRSSERAGILDYCRQKGLAFFAYMVLEQGALSGHYDTAHPFPPGSGRARTYGPILPKIEALTATMRTIGGKHGISVAQVAVAYAIAKGTIPIIGVTQANQVTDAAKAAEIRLSAEEIGQLEKTAEEADAD